MVNVQSITMSLHPSKSNCVTKSIIHSLFEFRIALQCKGEIDVWSTSTGCRQLLCFVFNEHNFERSWIVHRWNNGATSDE